MYLCTLSSDSSGQLDVLGHDGDPLGVDGAQVGVLEKSDEVSLAGLLESHDGRALNLKSVLKSWAISLTRRWKGNLRMRSSVDFWYLLISLRATVPGLYLWGFLTPPVAGADFLAALVANCLRGAFPPVDLRAVCLVRAMATIQK